jgi:hypothetical protein
VAAIRHKPDLGDRLGVVFVGVDELLRYEVLGFVLAGELDI